MRRSKQVSVSVWVLAVGASKPPVCHQCSVVGHTTGYILTLGSFSSEPLQPVCCVLSKNFQPLRCIDASEESAVSIHEWQRGISVALECGTASNVALECGTSSAWVCHWTAPVWHRWLSARASKCVVRYQIRWSDPRWSPPLPVHPCFPNFSIERFHYGLLLTITFLFHLKLFSLPRHLGERKVEHIKVYHRAS